MNLDYDNLALIFIGLPLVGACLLPFISRVHRRLIPGLATAINLILLGLSIAYVYHLADGEQVISCMAGLKVHLDSLSALFLLVISMVSLAVSSFSNRYMNRYAGKTKFYILLLVMLTGMYGLVMAPDLFGMYVYFEVAAIASYILVAFSLHWEGLEAAFKYIILSSISTLMILLGSTLLFYQFGTLNISELATLIPSSPDELGILVAGALLLCGFGFKAATIPFHAWLPDAHASAPAPISAMLSGVVIKVLGIYTLLRVTYDVFAAMEPFLNIMLTLGLFSIVLAGVLALQQTDMKRALAYSSIGQIGFILVSMGLGTHLGLLGALFHVFNHSLFKPLLFMNAGAVQERLGTRDLREMGGLENRMPVTTTTSVIGAMAISGVPPLNGFWSKLLIIMAAVRADSIATAVILIAGSLLTLALMLRIEKAAFFGQLKKEWEKIREVHWTMAVPMIYLATLCLVGGLGFAYILDNFITPAVDVLI